MAVFGADGLNSKKIMQIPFDHSATCMEDRRSLTFESSASCKAHEVREVRSQCSHC